MRWLIRFMVALIGMVAVAVYAVVLGPLRNPHPSVTLARGVLVIRNATVNISISPDASPLEDGTVLVRDGRIAAVGKEMTVPTEAVTIPCDHCVVMASGMCMGTSPSRSGTGPPGSPHVC